MESYTTEPNDTKNADLAVLTKWCSLLMANHYNPDHAALEGVCRLHKQLFLSLYICVDGRVFSRRAKIKVRSLCATRTFALHTHTHLNLIA